MWSGLVQMGLEAAGVRPTCPRCGGAVPAADINLKRMVAKCAACGAVFDFAPQLDGAADPGRAARPAVPLPPNLTVDHGGDGVVITFRWLRRKFVHLALVALVWDGFLLMGLAQVIRAGDGSLGVFLALHGAAGLFLTYYALAGLLNRTTVAVGASEVAVRHGPLPYPGRRLAAGAIRQLFCTEGIEGTTHVGRRTVGVDLAYAVEAATADGRRVTLVSGLASPEQALYLEQALERYLGIADAPRRGELRR